MQSEEIRQKFLDFFKSKEHIILPSASLVTADESQTDKTLFTTAGMQPLVPYLLGKPHPSGVRLASIQKCVRTVDIDDVGDNRHQTFFEMMGNWSLGDYFKPNAISWSFEFLTSKDKGLGLDIGRLYVTIFEGDDRAPFDEESKKIWLSLGIPEQRIYPLGKEDNWWSPGSNGPAGPDTEMFYDLTKEGLGNLSREKFISAVQQEDLVEIWNDVFMEYEQKDGKVVGKLDKKNVDTGAGLERITAVMQKVKTVYETDIFAEINTAISEISRTSDQKSQRILADHVRTSVFMIGDGIIPSNTDRGYVLRRLIRRAVRHSKKLNTNGSLDKVVAAVQRKYGAIYPEIVGDGGLKVQKIFQDEEVKFEKTLDVGLKEFEKGKDPFVLFTSYGFPLELAKEVAAEKGIKVDEKDFEQKFKTHQELSRTGSEQKFKGGLANTNPETIKLHTAHHLLLAALQKVLGKEVKQKGSNITEERLRMDFSFPRKLTAEELGKVEEIVNKHIKEGLTVTRKDMPRVEAETIGAEMEFGAKYPDVVSLYFIEDKHSNAISKEFCGGPHVSNTSELGSFKILKEEAVSTGVRRIKAVLE